MTLPVSADALEHTSQPAPRTRLLVAIALATVCGVYSAAINAGRPNWVPDFDQLWVAARALRVGTDPYAEVAARFLYPLYYPLPAVLVAWPFSFLPLPVARAVFTSLGAGLLAFAITGRGWWMLWVFASNSMREAVITTQWAGWMTAAALLPWLGWVLPAKPTIGLAVLGGFPGRRKILWALGIVALSFLVFPGWPLHWWAAIQVGTARPRAPITRPFGWVLLLALLRWRQPEARLLAGLALVPHTSVLYETVPLFLVCRNRLQVALLALSSYAVAIGGYVLGDRAGPLAPRLEALWPCLLIGMYLPALAFVLHRPNVAPNTVGA